MAKSFGVSAIKTNKENIEQKEEEKIFKWYGLCGSLSTEAQAQ